MSAPEKHAPKAQPTREIGLKIVRADGSNTYNSFVWPLEVGAVVTAPDWGSRSATECGGGLHFWPRGEGKVETCKYHAESDAIGLAIEYDPTKALSLDGGEKAKVETCVIVFRGTVREAAAFVARANPGARVIYGTATAGDSGTATAGYSGTATAGDRGTATAGDRGTATAGEYGLLSVLYYDHKLSVYRRKVAECDPAGPVLPWHRYTVSEAGEWVDGGEVPIDQRPAALLAAAMAKVER